MIDLQAKVRDAEEIRSSLISTGDDLAFAIERDSQMRRTSIELSRLYEDAEAEVAFELSLGIEGKNAESRKMGLDAALVKERSTGRLARPWAMMNAAKADAEEARMALEQASKKYRAVEGAADITANILRCLAGR